MKFILLVTHADDELVNMAHFLLKEDSSCILVTGGDEGRQVKFVNVMEEFNKDYIILPFTPDYLLSYDRDFVYNSIKERVEELLCWNELGSQLVVPSTFDTHPEHLLVSAIGCRIVGENPEEIPGVFSTSRNLERKKVKVPNKLDLLSKYYPGEAKNLIKTIELTKWEYHSGY